jgi:hypothetical protein
VKHFRSVSRMVENRVLCGAMILLGMSGILSAQAGQVQEQTYRQLTAAHPDWVQVPGQIMRADCVHEIPNGAKVVIGENGEPTGDVLLKGQVIAHHDACSEAPLSTKHTASVNKPGHTPGPPFNGWVEDSQESVSLGSSDNIDWESGEFYVPNAPSSNGGTIFLFNGIAPTAQNWILQPVLQYGVSAAGGGNYWAIASWFVGTGGAWHSPLAGVNPGNTIYGYTEQTATGGTLDYTSEAYDLSTGAYSWISIWSSGLHWTVAYEGVLEVYNVNSCSQLPSSGDALFFANFVDHGYPSYYRVTPGFTGSVFQSGCSDWTYVNNTYNVSPWYDYAYLFY